MDEKEAPPLRRRGERMRQAVLAATVDLLASQGMAATTVAAVARAAGVHETSVYRRWKTRENLIFDALAHHSDHALPTPDTGDVRADLTALFTALARYLATPAGTALLHLGTVRGEDDLEEGRRSYWSTRLERAEALVRRGIDRGELATDTDPHLTVEAVTGPLLARVLLTGEPLEETLVPRLVDLVLDGARAPRRQDRRQDRPDGS
ncbi:TetR/AcrR family transcriptional regulator C-terminal ligand-binding domain-containing protein [Streptomyces yunnanensis]|uniref:TetR/AcrR family transcriptional regulator C-terminal ligand-binding domain-containing protein n=1 Tax=Streptomyces yunnanensis TaxID=156453 RepID=A0ABY8AH60_9ACTN|nr:TetR-like C-terminal domain-containing protein [Streptomyces yunnanensis]WEB44365.1 TetR/AcrR family transcriptional regulator C-terminal ligand-binding domain-containing protein [Streptomyces yunnanensis]